MVLDGLCFGGVVGGVIDSMCVCLASCVFGARVLTACVLRVLKGIGVRGKVKSQLQALLLHALLPHGAWPPHGSARSVHLDGYDPRLAGLRAGRVQDVRKRDVAGVHERRDPRLPVLRVRGVRTPLR